MEDGDGIGTVGDTKVGIVAGTIARTGTGTIAGAVTRAGNGTATATEAGKSESKSELYLELKMKL